MGWRDRFHQVVHPPTARERKAIRTLREKMNALPALTISSTATKPERAWTEFRQTVRNSVSAKDPRYFLRWPVIQHTMFYPGHPAELAALQSAPSWGMWRQAILESPAGFPQRYPALPESSGNLIHHAYALWALEQNTTCITQRLKTVFEFGGGYGSTARLFSQLGFNGTYIIFDLPEFLLLQEFFLEHMNKGESIEFVSDFTDRRIVPHPDLFLAAWSLSESPLEVRKKMIPLIKGSQYVLIAYQAKFQDVDNEIFFKTLRPQAPGLSWKSVPIRHAPGNFFLIGERQ